MTAEEKILNSGLLGTMSDMKLAEFLGYHYPLVSRIRKESGVPVFKPVSKKVRLDALIEDLIALDRGHIIGKKEYVTFPLTKGHTCTVDRDVYELTSDFSWMAIKLTNCWYATTSYLEHRRHGRHVDKFLHQVILPAREGLIIDHINGNGLDNRLENLRYATKSTNGMNSRVRQQPNKSSKYKGVYFDKRTRRYDVYITKDQKRTYLGAYIDEGDAARAYNDSALEKFGEFSRLNIIEEIKG